MSDTESQTQSHNPSQKEIAENYSKEAILLGDKFFKCQLLQKEIEQHQKQMLILTQEYQKTVGSKESL